MADAGKHHSQVFCPARQFGFRRGQRRDVGHYADIAAIWQRRRAHIDHDAVRTLSFAVLRARHIERQLLQDDLLGIAVAVFAGGGAASDHIDQMVTDVQAYVPGYRLKAPPQFDRQDDGTWRVAIFVEVEGAGDFLPPYAGNLDIMTAAATKAAEEMAKRLIGANDGD